MKKIIFGLILFLPPLLLGQTTYYVSDQGSNSNNGLTLTTAWLTVDHAASTAITAGDIILIFTGDEFRETVTMDVSGTDGLPITLSIIDSATGLTGADAPGAKPIISGSDERNIWVDATGNVYYNLGLSTEPKIVILDGTVGAKAANSPAVDTQDEWFWTTSGDDTLFIYTTTATDTSNIEVGARYHLLVDNNKDYITFSNIKLKYPNNQAINIDGDNNIIDNCTIEDSPNYGMHITGENTEIKNCTLTGNVDQNIVGVYCTNTGFDIHDNTLSHWRIGIFVDNAGAADPFTGNIYSNTVDSLDMGDMSESDGIKCQNITGSTVDVYSNNVQGFAEDGIDISDCDSMYVWGNEVSYPISGHAAGGLKSGAGDVYNVFRYNYVHDLYVVGQEPNGINLGAGSKHLEFSYNVFANIGGHAISFWDTDSSSFFNNTIYNMGVDGIYISGTDSSIYLEIRNNISDANSADMRINANSTAYGSNNIFVNDAGASGSGEYTGTDDQGATDPLFTDAANDDFTLQPGSPAIDAGTDVGLTLDYDGNTVPAPIGLQLPDIGAFEYSEYEEKGFETFLKFYIFLK